MGPMAMRRSWIWLGLLKRNRGSCRKWGWFRYVYSYLPSFPFPFSGACLELVLLRMGLAFLVRALFQSHPRAIFHVCRRRPVSGVMLGMKMLTCTLQTIPLPPQIKEQLLYSTIQSSAASDCFLHFHSPSRTSRTSRGEGRPTRWGLTPDPQTPHGTTTQSWRAVLSTACRSMLLSAQMKNGAFMAILMFSFVMQMMAPWPNWSDRCDRCDRQPPRCAGWGKGSQGSVVRLVVPFLCGSVR